MANKIKLVRMFKDPFRPECHTYHLQDGTRSEHVCNLTLAYSPYYKRRMWELDGVLSTGFNKYERKGEAIADAIRVLAESKGAPEGVIAREYMKERELPFILPA